MERCFSSRVSVSFPADYGADLDTTGLIDTVCILEVVLGYCLLVSGGRDAVCSWDAALSDGILRGRVQVVHESYTIDQHQNNSSFTQRSN